MRIMVKLSFILAIFLFISCSDNFPDAPEFKFCKFEDASGAEQCKSIHEFPEKDCTAVGGEVVDSCTQ